MDGLGMVKWFIVEDGTVGFTAFVCRRAFPLRLRAQEGIL